MIDHDFQRGDLVRVKATIYDPWDSFVGTIVQFYEDDEVEVEEICSHEIILTYVRQLTLEPVL